MPDVTVSRDMATSPDAVWALVADLSRMPEWSPENERLEWLGGATEAVVGARFRGTNRNGSKSWKSVGEITALEPGRTLAFTVSAGPFKIADWSYSIDQTDEGCRVTETWTDRRGVVMRTLSRFVTGVDDRSTHNSRGMENTLQRIATAAEQPTAG